MGSTGPAAEATSPMHIGPYRITAVIGEGGMGVVYRGEHPDTGERVAIKTVRVASESLLAGIRRELHALSRIRHPGIARFLAEGVAAGLPWYAMELYEGDTLRGQLRRLPQGLPAASTVRMRKVTSTVDLAAPAGGPSAPAGGPSAPEHGIEARPCFSLGELARPLAWIGGACGPLAFLHGEGLVHRDLKPENVLVREDGRVVLVDLGIATSFGDALGREEITAEASAAGSVAYMAPEQIRGELVDARADLYALGCMLYEVLTGRTPFVSDSASTLLYKHLHEPPLPPSRLVDGIPPELEAVVLRALEKRPEERLGHAGDIAEVLRSLGVPVPETPGAPRARAYLYRPALAGRVEILSELDGAIERTFTERRSGLYLLGGESGVGKTRIAMEIARRATRRGMRVIAGQCVSLGVGAAGTSAAVPLHPFRPLLVAVADRCRAEGDGEAERLLGAGGKVLARYEPALAELPWVEAQPEPPALPPDAAKRRVLDAIDQALAALAEDRPLLWMIDDLQWADELSSSFLRERSGRQLDERPVLILGTYRMEELSDELAALVRSEGAHDIAVSRLDDTSVGAMVSGMLALREPPADLVRFLAARSDGNPFFVAEYLRAAIGEGLLTRDRLGQWHLHERAEDAGALAASVRLPTALAALIEHRLSVLGREERGLVEWAAVLGREMDGALLAAVSGLRDGEMLEALEALRVRQVLEEAAPGRLRFVHDKIRESAYERIGTERRRELHRGAASELEARFAGEPDVWPDLGLHFARAHVHDRASAYFARAADRARQVYANGAAIGFYRSAIGELQSTWSEDAAPGGGRAARARSLHESLGDVLVLVGRQEEARQAYESALGLVPHGKRANAGRLHRKIGETQEHRQQFAEALEAYRAAEAELGAAEDPGDPAWWDEWMDTQIARISVHYWQLRVTSMQGLVDRVRPVVETRGTPRQRARFFRALAQVHVHMERSLPSALTVGHARACLEAAREHGDLHEIATAMFGLSAILLWHGALAEAEVGLSDALHVAERIGDARLQARCVAYQTMLLRRRGHVEEARRVAERCLRAADRAGMREYTATATANLGWAAWKEGDLRTAEEQCRAALAIWRSISLEYPFQWQALFPLAAVLLSSGRTGEGVAQVEAALDPRQQRLPDGLQAAAERCVRGRGGRRRRSLERFLEEVAREGYL